MPGKLLLLLTLPSLLLGCPRPDPSLPRVPLVCTEEIADLPLLAWRINTTIPDDTCYEEVQLRGVCEVWYPVFNATDPIWGGACEPGNWAFTDVATGDCIQSQFECFVGPPRDRAYASCRQSTYEDCCTNFEHGICWVPPQ